MAGMQSANTTFESDETPSLVVAAGLATAMFGILSLLALLTALVFSGGGTHLHMNLLGGSLVAGQGIIFVTLGYCISRNSRLSLWLGFWFTVLVFAGQVYLALAQGRSAYLFVIFVAPIVGILNYLALRRRTTPGVPIQ